MGTATLTVLAVTTIGSGLVAGLLFAFSCSVMRGLRAVDDGAFVAVMRAINVAVFNPWFLGVTGGTLVASLVALVLALGVHPGVAPWAVAGAASYLATVLITGRGNVPLNERLEAAGQAGMDAATARAAFERPWVRLNHARSATATAAFVCWAAASAGVVASTW